MRSEPRSVTSDMTSRRTGRADPGDHRRPASPGRPDAGISVQAVCSSDVFARLGPEWNALLARSAAKNFFLRWEWLWTWWRIFGSDDARLCIIVVERNQELLGLAPCYIKRESAFRLPAVRTLMFLGSGEREHEEIYSEYLDIISQAGEEDRVARHVVEFILSKDICDAIRLSNVLLDSRTVAVLRQICLDRSLRISTEVTTESLFITLPRTWDEYLASRSSSMRYEIRSDRRKLHNLGDVKVRKTESPETLEEDVRELSRLHQAHWRSKGMPSAFGNEKFSSFHRTVMPTMLENGHLELWLLSLSSRNLAACYNIRFAGKIYFYQCGFDHGVARNVSVGLVLQSYSVEDAIASGIAEYDFMGGGGRESYKGRWAHEGRSVGEVCVPLSVVSIGTFGIRQMAQAVKRGLAWP